MSARRRGAEEPFEDYKARLARHTAIEKAKHSLGNGRISAKVERFHTEHQAKEVAMAIDAPEEKE